MNKLELHKETNTLMKPYAIKNLATGYLSHHYRASNDFIIRETVLKGFKKDFLDSIDVFTSQGHFIGKVYRIRESEFSDDCSTKLVIKILTEYLYSNANNHQLAGYIHDLYNVNVAHHEAIVNNFIELHEK